jgi:hypothetical protein
LLRRSSTLDTCKAIWDFIYDYVQYKLDKRGLEQLRRPARSWRRSTAQVKHSRLSTIWARSLRRASPA